MTEADECTCGRYHSASEWTCYKCGKLVSAIVGTNEIAAIQAQTKRVSVMDEAKAYVISDSQEMLNFYRQTWNEAIEAVLKIGFNGRKEMLIRELKK